MHPTMSLLVIVRCCLDRTEHNQLWRSRLKLSFKLTIIICSSQHNSNGIKKSIYLSPLTTIWNFSEIRSHGVHRKGRDFSTLWTPPFSACEKGGVGFVGCIPCAVSSHNISLFLAVFEMQWHSTLFTWTPVSTRPLTAIYHPHLQQTNN